MAAQSLIRAKKIARNMRELRNKLWPNLDENTLWHYKRSNGWLNVPRPLPILLRIMDILSKGKPVSSTYLELLCRTFDDSFVVTNKPREMALFAGFSGERAERTWVNRMQILEKLGFIEIKEGSSGKIGYALILNPYHVVYKLNTQGKVDSRLYNSLLQRMNEVGAQDLEKIVKENKEQVEGMRISDD